MEQVEEVPQFPLEIDTSSLFYFHPLTSPPFLGSAVVAVLLVPSVLLLLI